MEQRNYIFTSDWFAGFTQSDGSFIISFEKTSKGKLPIRPRPIFVLTQSRNEEVMFKSLQNYLKIGKLQFNKNNITLVIKSLEEIVTVLLPIFDNSPLRGSKLISYQIFKYVSLMMANKNHLTIEGTLQILNLSYFMNKETSLRTEELKQDIIAHLIKPIGVLPKFENISLPKLNDKDILPLSLEFIRGQVDGDGSFNVSFRTKQKRIGVNFTVVHELSSISVLNELTTFFKCGKVYRLPSAAARYQVQTVDDILNKIYPIFKDIQFNTVKQEQFNVLIKVCEQIKIKGYRNYEDLKAIVDLAWDMNKSGKARKLSKEQYLKLFNKT